MRGQPLIRGVSSSRHRRHDNIRRSGHHQGAPVNRVSRGHALPAAIFVTQLKGWRRSCSDHEVLLLLVEPARLKSLRGPLKYDTNLQTKKVLAMSVFTEKLIVIQ